MTRTERAGTDAQSDEEYRKDAKRRANHGLLYSTDEQPAK